MEDLANGNLTHNPKSAQNSAISALVLRMQSHLAKLFPLPSLKPCLLLHFTSGFDFYRGCWICFFHDPAPFRAIGHTQGPSAWPRRPRTAGVFVKLPFKCSSA